MRLSLVGAWLVYVVVRVFIASIQAISLDTCQQISRGLAVLFCDILGVRRQVVEENLHHAFPELSRHQRRRLARRMWEHLFLMVCEVAHLPRKVHEHNWHQHIHLDDREILFRYVLDPRPKVLLSGHLGNFEFAGYVAALMGMPTVTIARPLDNPFLHRFINRFRGGAGQRMLPKEGSSQQVADILDRGGTLGLLADQYAGPKGCWVNFFNRPVSCHKALAVFPLGSGAPLLVTYALRRDRPLHFGVGTAGVLDPRDLPDEMASVPAITQWYCDRLEEITRRAPEQYWWLHRRWKDTRTEKQRERARRLDAAHDQPAPPVPILPNSIPHTPNVTGNS